MRKPFRKQTGNMVNKNLWFRTQFLCDKQMRRFVFVWSDEKSRFKVSIGFWFPLTNEKAYDKGLTTASENISCNVKADFQSADVESHRISGCLWKMKTKIPFQWF